jgi:hypothetical protein
VARPKNASQRQRFNMQMWPEDRARLDRLALGYGMRHGDLVSAAQMVERLIREAPDPLEGADFGGEIADCLHEQQPFRMTYRSAKGNERVYEVCGGRILALPQGGMLLAVVPIHPEGRQNDSPELPMNWLMRLDRVTDLEVLEDSRWMELPRALASFRLASFLAPGYRPHPEDQGIETEPDGSLLIRRWYAHRWELRPLLLTLGANAELLSPEPFRAALAQEVRSMHQQYAADT